MPFDNQGNWYEERSGGGGGGGGNGPVEIELEVEPKQVLLGFWGLILAAFAIWGVMTSFFTVEANEQAVILRLCYETRCRWARFHANPIWCRQSVQRTSSLFSRLNSDIGPSRPG